MMKDTSKESMMVGTDIVTDTVTMIPVATMTITKPDTKRAMKKDMMKAIVKVSPIMKKPKKMKNPKMNGNKLLFNMEDSKVVLEDGLLQPLPPEVEVEAELDKVLDEEDIY